MLRHWAPLAGALLTVLVTAALASAGCSSGGSEGAAVAAEGGNGGGAPPPSSGGASNAPPGTNPWHVPACTAVTGAPVTFTADGGLSRATVQATLTESDRTGVAVLPESTLVSVVRHAPLDVELFFSTDAGCTWAPSRTITDLYSADVTTAGTYTFIWGDLRGGTDAHPTSGGGVYVVSPDGVATRREIGPQYPGFGIHGFAADRSNPDRLRASLYTCIHRSSCGTGTEIVESLDGGATWAGVGQKAPYGAFDMVFSPLNLDHVIVTGAFHPAHVTFDGGSQWMAARGLPTDRLAAHGDIGPDGLAAWLVLYVPSSQPWEPAGLYLSRDGGLSYQIAVTATDEEAFDDGTRLFPDPVDPDVIYFTYASADRQTSYLYRYDASLNELEKQEWPSAQGSVSSIAFNPSDPATLYLGLFAR